MERLTYSANAHANDIYQKEGFKRHRIMAGDVHAVYEYGVYFSKNGDYEEAYPYLKAALNLYRGDIDVAKAFIKCCFKLGKTQEEAEVCKQYGLKTMQEKSNSGDLKDKLSVLWEKYNVMDYSFSQKPMLHIAWFVVIFLLGEIPGMILGVEVGLAICGFIFMTLGVLFAVQKIKRIFDVKMIGEETKWVKVKNDPYKNDPDMCRVAIRGGVISFQEYSKSFVSYGETYDSLPSYERDAIKSSYSSICESTNDNVNQNAMLKQATRCNNLMKRYLKGETQVLPVLQYLYDVTYENDKFVNGFKDALFTYTLK